MTVRLSAAGLALALLLPALAAAQNPFANKKFVQGLIGMNVPNVASVVYAGTDAADPGARLVVSINYGLGARQVEVTRPKAPKRTVTTVSGGVGWTVTDKGRPVASLPAVAAFERAIAMTPHGVFKAAQLPEAKAVVADVPGPGGRTYTTVALTAAGARLKATLNEAGLVERVETVPGDGAAGSDAVVVTYADYKDVDGIKFPMRITETRNGATVLDLTLTEIRPNAGFYAEPPGGLTTR